MLAWPVSKQFKVIGEEVMLVGRDVAWDAARDGALAALALAAVAVRVENAVHLGDAKFGQVVEDGAGSEID